jgi:Mce-associated membrane protein
MRRDLPTTQAPRPPGPRRRIAGDRVRRDPGSAAAPADRLEVVTRAGRPEVLTSDDPITPPPELEPDPDEGDSGTRSPSAAVRRSQHPAWIVVALAASLVAVLAACVLAAVTTRHQRADLRAGDAALAAAKPDTVKILSYDYRHLDADFAAASAVTTGSFRADYQATTAKAVKALATQTNAVVVARVVAGGVVDSTADRATLLLFVNQTTTSNRLSAAKTDLTRVLVTMTKSGSRWLVSGVKAL